MPWRTALVNVMAGLEFRGQLSIRDVRAVAEDWPRRVGGFGGRCPHQRSGGMRKRTALAQTLALDPDLILMDEAFSAIWEVLRDVVLEGHVQQLKAVA